MWKKIVKEFQNSPRDVKTVPVNNTKGVWFYVFVEQGNLRVFNAREHEPSCEMSAPRVLAQSEFDDILNIYQRRKHGEHVSREAQVVTYNQVYWYGILSEMNM